MASRNDPLFLERLDIFMETCLTEIRDFALREQRDFEEVRGLVIDWHWRQMLNPTGHSGAIQRDKVKHMLQTTSNLLNNLSVLAGVHSLLLSVIPEDDNDSGYVGGSPTGREFWLSMRNGGTTGICNFKQFCKDTQSPGSAHPTNTMNFSEIPRDTSEPQVIKSGKSTPAVVLKNQLYVEMRNVLRSVSGVRNAEMKWSKQSKLSGYGVSLVGWPREIEYKNPSKMSYQETSTILSLLRQGTLHFESLGEKDPRPPKPNQSETAGPSIGPPLSGNDSETDISWAYNDIEPDLLGDTGK